MRKTGCILPGLMLLLPAGSCTLFRQVAVSRQDSFQTSSRKASLEWDVDSVASRTRVFSYADSSGAQFEVEIVPSGEFTFSARGGFAGSASLVRLRGRSESGSRTVDSSSERQHVQSTGILDQKVKARIESTEKHRVREGNNNHWWLLILFAAFLLAFLVVKKVALRSFPS